MNHMELNLKNKSPFKSFDNLNKPFFLNHLKNVEILSVKNHNTKA